MQPSDGKFIAAKLLGDLQQPTDAQPARQPPNFTYDDAFGELPAHPLVRWSSASIEADSLAAFDAYGRPPFGGGAVAALPAPATRVQSRSMHESPAPRFVLV